MIFFIFAFSSLGLSLGFGFFASCSGLGSAFGFFKSCSGLGSAFGFFASCSGLGSAFGFFKSCSGLGSAFGFFKSCSGLGSAFGFFKSCSGLGSGFGFFASALPAILLENTLSGDNSSGWEMDVFGGIDVEVSWAPRVYKAKMSVSLIVSQFYGILWCQNCLHTQVARDLHIFTKHIHPSIILPQNLTPNELTIAWVRLVINSRTIFGSNIPWQTSLAQHRSW